MYSFSWNEFLKSANEFAKISETYEDGWCIIEKDKEEGNTYLSFRQKLNVNFDEKKPEDEDLSLQFAEDDFLESAPSDSGSTQMPETNKELVDIEYHVVYSISYQVPVLYFKGYRSHGKPLGLDDAWKIFQNPAGDSRSRVEMLSTLTQSDHPVLSKPYLNLHPCRTAELLSQMGESGNVVLTFLSIMGPYVRLTLRNEYGLTFKDP